MKHDPIVTLKTELLGELQVRLEDFYGANWAFSRTRVEATFSDDKVSGSTWRLFRKIFGDECTENLGVSSKTSI